MGKHVRAIGRTLMAVGLVSGLLASCGGSEGTASSVGGTTGATIRVALVLPGSADDKGFNQAAYEALPILE